MTVRKQAFWLALLITCAPVLGLPREVVEQVKKMTVLVEVHIGKERGFGTAWCINAKGTFVTNAHVVQGGRKFTVILSPGEADQRIVPATVLKVDTEKDLALIQVNDAGSLKALELGDASTLFDTMDLTAFGYPFGGALAMSEKEYPSISVSTGHITSLRKKAGELEVIQLDAVLNPGNSGGPVLDGNGRVVGIVQAGLPGAGINFAIPVSRLQKFLKEPAVASSGAPAPDASPAGEPSGRPDSGRPDPSLSASSNDPFNSKEWELTSYLKGTAAQLKQKLNGEQERLVDKITDTRIGIEKNQHAIVVDEQKAIDEARQTPAYKQMLAEKTKAEKDLETARKTGSPEDRLEASSRFNKARLALESMEHGVILGSAALAKDKSRVSELSSDLKRYYEGYDKAEAWRSELLEATRNGFMMKGPARDGVKGVLPRAIVYKVVDGSHLIVDYELLTFDFEHPGKDKEGIKVYPATPEKIKILLSGYDTAKLLAGDVVNIDHVYVLDGRRHTENQGTVYTASPFATEADRLFDAIVPCKSLDRKTKKTKQL